MGFLETSDLANAVSFRLRLTSCIVKVAGTILAEDQNSMGKPQGDKRVELASAVMRAPETQVSAFIWPVLSNSTIAGAGLDAADGDIEYQVTQVWDQVAGVTRYDKIVATTEAVIATP